MCTLTEEQLKPLKKILVHKALEKHSEVLYYCGSKTNWDDCFEEYNFHGKKHLAFYYNLKSGATHTELIEV